jgi:hypothetical protein
LSFAYKHLLTPGLGDVKVDSLQPSGHLASQSFSDFQGNPNRRMMILRCPGNGDRILLPPSGTRIHKNGGRRGRCYDNMSKGSKFQDSKIKIESWNTLARILSSNQRPVTTTITKEQKSIKISFVPSSDSTLVTTRSCLPGPLPVPLA